MGMSGSDVGEHIGASFHELDPFYLLTDSHNKNISRHLLELSSMLLEGFQFVPSIDN